MGSPRDMDVVHQQLVQLWGMRPVGGLEPLGRDAIIEELVRRVAYLLQHDLDKLMSYMYILDVPEEKFAYAIQRPAHEFPERLLAEVILEREIERMHTWRRYSQPAVEDETAARFDGWPRDDR